MSTNTTTSIPPLSDSQEAQISIYRIAMPAFAIFCIIINISVVFSSGLILKKSKNPPSTPHQHKFHCEAFSRPTTKNNLSLPGQRRSNRHHHQHRHTNWHFPTETRQKSQHLRHPNWPDRLQHISINILCCTDRHRSFPIHCPRNLLQQMDVSA